MTSETPTDVLPILADAGRGFDAALRGYDRTQVDHYLDEADDEVRTARAERDAALSRSADLAAQLASALAQIESLRRQVTDAEERVSQRIRLRAEQEAQEILARATQRHAEADEMFRQRLAEAERRRTDIETALARTEAESIERDRQLTEAARSTREQLDASSTAERDRLDAESLAARTQADTDFELVLRERRSAELAESQRIKDEARATAEQIVAAATERARELHDYRNAVHTQLRDLHLDIGGTLESSVDASPTSPLPSE